MHDDFCEEHKICDMSATRKLLKAINDNLSDGVMLLATVNDTEMLCSALKRSGRFDRILHIDKQNKRDRLEIIRFYEKNKNFDPKIDFETTAKMTSGFSGADIECIMNEAGLKATLEGRDAILQKDIDFAIVLFFRGASKTSPEKKKRGKLLPRMKRGI